MLKKCWEVIKAKSGPINYYWTLHLMWCLFKVKHIVNCNLNGAWKFRSMLHSLLVRVETDTNHQSATFLHTFCHKMHDCTPTMPLIDRHTPDILCVRERSGQINSGIQLRPHCLESFHYKAGPIILMGCAHLSFVYRYISCTQQKKKKRKKADTFSCLDFS